MPCQNCIYNGYRMCAQHCPNHGNKEDIEAQQAAPDPMDMLADNHGSIAELVIYARETDRKINKLQEAIDDVRARIKALQQA